MSDKSTPEKKEPTQEELDAQARARQDVSQHPRMQAMSAIAQKHEQDIEEQLQAEGLTSRVQHGEQPPQGQRTPPPDDDTQRPQQQTTQAPTKTTQAQTTPTQPTAVDPQLLQQLGTEPLPMEALDGLKLRFRVAGEERIVTMHDLRREAQLDGAAAKRLEEANAILKQAQEAAARAQATTPTGSPTTQQPPVGVEPKQGSGDSSATSEDATAIAKDLVQALFVGDEEAAVASVLKVLTGPQSSPQQIDPAAIAARVAPAVRQQLSQEEAEAKFRSDYKDVVGDPILVAAADRFFEEARAEDPQKSYAELLSEAGNRTRTWLQARTGGPATEPTQGSTRKEKLEAKQRIDNVRSLGRTEVKQEPVIETASQVIQQMREARGLA